MSICRYKFFGQQIFKRTLLYRKMENIKITFLGTGNAIPTSKRNHTAIFCQIANEGLLIDCGEGTQRQFMHAKIPHNKINHIFITHWHGDHILGIPGLMQTLVLEGYQKTLHIHGPKGTNRHMQQIVSILGKSAENIKFHVHEIPQAGQILESKDFIVECLELEHGTPALGYSVSIKEKRKIIKSAIKKYKLPNSPLLRDLQNGKDIMWNGKKISAKNTTYVEHGKKVTFILDSHNKSNSYKLAKDSDLLVSESTFVETERQKADEALHLTAKDAATIAKKSNSKKLALIHISQRYEHDTSVIEKEAKKIFKNVILPKDLDVIEI